MTETDLTPTTLELEDPDTSSLLDTIRDLGANDLRPARLLFTQWRASEIDNEEALRGLASHVGGVVAAIGAVVPALRDRRKRQALGVDLMAEALEHRLDDKQLIPGMENRTLVELFVAGAVGLYRHERGKEAKTFKFSVAIPVGGGGK